MESGQPLTSRELDALRATQRILGAAYRLCRERSIRFVVVFAPKEYRVYQGLSNFIEPSQEVARWVVNDLPGRVRSMVSEISSDIEYVDLTPVFRSKAEQGARIFLQDDIHWSSEGHRLAAEEIDRALSSSGYAVTIHD